MSAAPDRTGAAHITLALIPKFPVALRFALRELRGGLRGFRIFIACLALGVAVIATVGSLTRAIEDSLESQGQSILGADFEVRLFQREADKALYDWVQGRGDISASSRLRTMGRNPATQEATLVELRAVDSLYPMYGDLVTDPELSADRLFDARDGVWGAVIDPLVASRLGLETGDRLTLGTTEVEIRALLTKAPDQAHIGFQLGPTVMVRPDVLAASGLVTQGSLITYYYRIKLDAPDSLDDALKALKADFPDETWRITNRRNPAPGFSRGIEQIGEFLVIVGLASLVVGGVGVGNAVKGYMDRKTKTIATLKILGADGATIFWTYFAQVLIIAALAITAGLGIGAITPLLAGAYLPNTVPIEITTGLYPEALVIAALYGILVTIAFTAWPLGVARDLPAVRLFRTLIAADAKAPRGLYVALIAAAGLGVAVLALILAGNRLLAAGFLGGALFSLVLLRASSWLIERAAARAPRPKGALMRMALANLHRPGSATGAVVISLGLGLTLFASMQLISGNLRATLDTNFPDDAPAFFFVDIQNWQLNSFLDTASGIDGVSNIRHVPALRGTIKTVNGTPAADAPVSPDFRWLLRGDRGLSYEDTLGKGSQLVEGTWWDPDYQGPPQISLGRDAAEGLGIGLGDTLTVTVLGRDITAEIVSLREIEWGTFGFNFVILFDPHTLKAAPHTYYATLSASGTAEEAAYATLTLAFPGVTVVRMKDVLSSVNDVVGSISTAVDATSAIAVISGILVLAGAIAAGFRQRVYESVILKVVGAVRSQILWAYTLEFIAIGLVTALIALALALLAGWATTTLLWEQDFIPQIWPMLIVVVVALVVTVGAGLASSWRALGYRPNQVLREE